MSQLTYRLATLTDFEELYRIKCDKENIAWGGFTQVPEKESFYQWYQRQLASDCRWIYLVYEGEDCCAFFYVDKLEDGTFEASASGVLSEFMGKGIGTCTLSMQVAEIENITSRSHTSQPPHRRGGGMVYYLLGIRQKYRFLQAI